MAGRKLGGGETCEIHHFCFIHLRASSVLGLAFETMKSQGGLAIASLLRIREDLGAEQVF